MYNYIPYTEEVIRHYFCARCGKKISPNRGRVKTCFREMQILTENLGQKTEKSFLGRCALNSFAGKSEYYLCVKCCKDFSKFLNNTYKFDEKERETELLEQIEDLKAEFLFMTKSLIKMVEQTYSFSMRLKKMFDEGYIPLENAKERLEYFEENGVAEKAD